MGLIECSAYLKISGCGECWGAIVLATGNRGLLVASRQEARTSLLRAVELGLVSNEERMVVEAQIDMSCLPNSPNEADEGVRYKIAVLNLRGVHYVNSFDEPVASMAVEDYEEFEEKAELLREGCSDEDLLEQLSSDDFSRRVHGGDPSFNPEGLPVC